jgi:hypothetical protein
MDKGINIFSGEPGLGGALTNPTELARRKGGIAQAYGVRFAGRDWPDAETAYHALKTADFAHNDALMVDLIEAKFRQHATLHAEVRARGGREFLASCSHFTNSRSDAGGWEGQGLDSRFIRNLVQGYERLSAPHASEGGQGLLF